ncbi:uncharacterized protein LOC107042831 [Diachasma alloeum]|uniref:uncharacterized protein LOC107042831 n=1 Tax=Diachasma alloeum TaxID=454923 RepID=UPI0007384CF6|nr:uncharacterized protein LOC107042831 [Diachasma alloeum]
MRYIDPVSRSKPKNPDYALSGIIMTIEALQKLWEFLQTKGFTELIAKHISQDILENFNGGIRSYGGLRSSPSCWQFMGNYRALLISNLSKVKKNGFNCEQSCDGDLLFTLEGFITEDRLEAAEGPRIIVAVDKEDELPAYFTDTQIARLSGEEELETNLTDSADKIKEKLLRNPLLKEIIDDCCNCRRGFLRPQASNNKKSNFDIICQQIHKCLFIIITKVYFWQSITTVLIKRVLDDVKDTWLFCERSDHRRSLHHEIVKISTERFIPNWVTMINRHLMGTANNMRDYPGCQQAVQMYERTHSRTSKKNLPVGYIPFTYQLIFFSQMGYPKCHLLNWS